MWRNDGLWAVWVVALAIDRRTEAHPALVESILQSIAGSVVGSGEAFEHVAADGKRNNDQKQPDPDQVNVHKVTTCQGSRHRRLKRLTTSETP